MKCQVLTSDDYIFAAYFYTLDNYDTDSYRGNIMTHGQIARILRIPEYSDHELLVTLNPMFTMFEDFSPLAEVGDTAYLTLMSVSANSNHLRYCKCDLERDLFLFFMNNPDLTEDLLNGMTFESFMWEQCGLDFYSESYDDPWVDEWGNLMFGNYPDFDEKRTCSRDDPGLSWTNPSNCCNELDTTWINPAPAGLKYIDVKNDNGFYYSWGAYDTTCFRSSMAQVDASCAETDLTPGTQAYTDAIDSMVDYECPISASECSSLLYTGVCNRNNFGSGGGGCYTVEDDFTPTSVVYTLVDVSFAT